MQSVPLEIPHIFHRAEQQFGAKRIVSSLADRIHEISVAEWSGRVRRLSGALDVLGLGPGAPVATFGFNSQRHLELYFAVPCSGRVLHPLNIRLSLDQLEFIVAQAKDEVVFIDQNLLPVLWPLADRVGTVRHWVVMDDGSGAGIPDDPRIERYEHLLAASAPFEGTFSVGDENRAAGVCYTSGTTGNPKGVVYSHRSTVLHALVSLASGLLGISEGDVVMPVVPMFHASAWGLPYSALFAGADLVLPGADMSPGALLQLMSRERVTVASAVPAIWATLLPHVADVDLGALRAVFGGGSPTPPRLAAEWDLAVGVPITHTWGMTELSPTGAVGGTRSFHRGADEQERLAILASQGSAIPLVDLRIVDLETGAVQPRDGVAVGELQAHGPTVAGGYLGVDDDDAMTSDGWLRTGDLASIDGTGYVLIRDRIKDLIKSGGEWIPTQQLETAILSHPSIDETAVVGRPDPRWSERPVAFIVTHDSTKVSKADLLDHLAPRVPKWWFPDEVYSVEELPRTTTGKIAKQELRRPG